MRDAVKWRKQSRLIMMLAEWKDINPEAALDLFYTTNTYHLLCNPATGLELMSDAYIFADLQEELNGIK